MIDLHLNSNKQAGRSLDELAVGMALAIFGDLIYIPAGLRD